MGKFADKVKSTATNVHNAAQVKAAEILGSPVTESGVSTAQNIASTGASGAAFVAASAVAVANALRHGKSHAEKIEAERNAPEADIAR